MFNDPQLDARRCGQVRVARCFLVYFAFCLRVFDLEVFDWDRGGEERSNVRLRFREEVLMAWQYR